MQKVATDENMTKLTTEVIERFNAAFNAHDVDAVMSLMTEEVIFENTEPRPDGARFAGQAAVRAYWEQFFAGSPHAHFDTEELVAYGDRAFVRWRYTWDEASGSTGHVRGVDLFRVRDGKVAEKLAYVKG